MPKSYVKNGWFYREASDGSGKVHRIRRASGNPAPSGERESSDPATVRHVETAQIGPIATEVKKRVTPKRWKRIVREAHRRGFTVNDFLDASLPNALKARTKRSIRDEVSSLMETTYKPAEKLLTRQETRVKAVSDKLARDNQFYLDWLNSKSQELDTHARAADQAMLDRHKGIQQDLAAQMSELQQNTMQQAAETAGNVSDPKEAAAFEMSDEQQRNLEMVSNSREFSQDIVKSSQENAAAVTANNFAVIAAQEADRVSNTWKQLAEIGDDRQRLAFEKASESAKEIQRLLDNEVTKAQGNREFKAVLERIGVDREELAADIFNKKEDRELRLDELEETKRANEEAERDRDDERDRKRDADRDRDARERARISLEEQRVEISKGQLDLGWYKAKNPSKGSGSGGKGVKSDDPQKRFEAGFAALVTSERANSKNPDITYKVTPKWVADNRNMYINELVKTGLSRKLATAVVDAFIRNKSDKDPGSYRQYTGGADGRTPDAVDRAR